MAVVVGLAQRRAQLGRPAGGERAEVGRQCAQLVEQRLQGGAHRGLFDGQRDEGISRCQHSVSTIIRTAGQHPAASHARRDAGIRWERR